MAFGKRGKLWIKEDESKAELIVKEMNEINDGVNELISTFGGEILSSITEMDDDDMAGFKKMLKLTDTSLMWFDHFTELVAEMDNKLDKINERLDSIDKKLENKDK